MDDAKARRLKALMDEVMSEIADEVVDENTIELLRKNIRKQTAKAGLKYNASSINLYLEAFEFAFSAFANMGPQGAMPLLIGLRKIQKTQAGETKTVDLGAIEDAMKRSKEDEK